MSNETVSDERLIEMLDQWALDIDRDGTPSQVGPTAEELRQIANSLRSKPVASGVEVKSLEWEAVGDLRRAATAFGFSYFVNPRTNMWIGQADDWAIADDPSAAAEADFRNRILSALIPKATAPVVSDKDTSNDAN